jgi:stage III sporulation protein AE
MRKVWIFLVLIFLTTGPVRAFELTPPKVPKGAVEFMPSEPNNLQDGIRQVLKQAIYRFRPDLKEASRVCIGLLGSVMVLSLLRSLSNGIGKTADLAGTVAVSVLFLSSAGSLINLGAQTVRQISDYGKLLLPVLTAALSAQGGVTTSAALYSGTALFDAILSGLISTILIPIVYIFLALATANSAIGEDLLKKFRDSVKWLMTWILKTTLYIFTGFITITGVVSGPTDAAALKAAKLTISGVVPVVGGILSDASEAVLVSAAAVKNAVGLYGMFAIIALWMGPFLKIGAHYLMLRLTGAVCSVFGSKQICDLIQDFASAMGFLVAMTGACCLMLVISTVCFMRGGM